MIKPLSKLTTGIFAAAIILQLIMPFVYPIVGHDAAVHLNWLGQFPRLFREGNFCPRWMPDSFWGFGSPAFYFYPPLLYWCASFISYIWPDPVAMYQVLGILITIISGFTCYLYLRSLTRDLHTPVIGALIYSMAPYRLLDLYLRNALSEHLAFVLLPLVFLGIETALGYTKGNRKKIFLSINISAIAWSGLFLTNIPVSIIVVYSALIYSLLRITNKKDFYKLLISLTGAIIGLMIAAIYLFPVAEFSSSVKMNHLWDIRQAEGDTGFSLVDITHGNYRYFYIGLIITLFSGVWLSIKFFHKIKLEKIYKPFYVLLIIAVGFQIPFAFGIVWNNLPLMKLLQFTWRWNVIIVFLSAVYIALHNKNRENLSTKMLSNLLLIATIIIAGGYYFTMNGSQWKYKEKSGHPDAPEYVAKSASNNYEIVRDEFKDHAADPLIIVQNDSSHIHISEEKPTYIKFSTDAIIGTPAIFHRMYFPAWKLRMDNGQEVPLTSDSLGRITAELPSIAGEYILSLEKSSSEEKGQAVSIAGISLLAISLGLTIFLRSPKAS
jgi:hypothetical protein